MNLYLMHDMDMGMELSPVLNKKNFDVYEFVLLSLERIVERSGREELEITEAAEVKEHRKRIPHIDLFSSHVKTYVQHEMRTDPLNICRKKNIKRIEYPHVGDVYPIPSSLNEATEKPMHRLMLRPAIWMVQTMSADMQ
ncbi:hypothetical protein GQ457_07G019600 [Hibiscus cannabinus]